MREGTAYQFAASGSEPAAARAVRHMKLFSGRLLMPAVHGNPMPIALNVDTLRKLLPPSVSLLAASKGRGMAEIEEALRAGVAIFGENYVQEAVGQSCTSSAISRKTRSRGHWKFLT